MANAMEAALKEIYFSVPREILDLAFIPQYRRITLDKCIQDDVIISKVIYDCNTVAGKQTNIVLQPEWVIPAQLPSPYAMFSGNTYAIYRIPAEARENRPIVDVISVNYPGPNYNGLQAPTSLYSYGASGMGNTVGGLACSVMDSFAMNGAAAPTPIRLSGHEVKLTPVTLMFDQNIAWILTCKLAYDDEMTNLTNNAIRAFVDLAVTAVKAYIYNKLIVQMDSAYLSGGRELGAVKDVVSSYSDAMSTYQEKLNRFHGGAIGDDPELRAKRIWYAL